MQEILFFCAVPAMPAAIVECFIDYNDKKDEKMCNESWLYPSNGRDGKMMQFHASIICPLPSQ